MDEPIQAWSGRSMAESWWGKAWNRNIESYAAYTNRLQRGRTYAKNGSVLDLRISEGRVTAKVRGSRPRPYKVTVDIEPLGRAELKKVEDECSNRISDMDMLVNGDFPEDVGEMFLSQDGLFPKPEEIGFTCSCPDYAYMCKHVAAVMYGIGRRLDSDPTLFFTLRSVDMESLVGRSVHRKVESMLENAYRPSPRILDESRMAELFGMQLSSTVPVGRSAVPDAFGQRVRDALGPVFDRYPKGGSCALEGIMDVLEGEFGTDLDGTYDFRRIADGISTTLDSMVDDREPVYPIPLRRFAEHIRASNDRAEMFGFRL